MTPGIAQDEPVRVTPRTTGTASADGAIEPAAPQRLDYNASLDGLRALAVLAVMAYHHGTMSGGFLGVDMFFVLSGYLITTLLLGEHRREGRISFRSFYARRVRRLLPALLIALFGTAIYAYLLAPDLILTRLRRDTFGSLFYVQNWLLAREPVHIPHGPLDPTWSLSVEEQWYLIWPIALAGFLVLRNRRTLLAALVMLTSACVIWTMYLTTRPTGGTHITFGSDTRGQALLVGALLAVVLNAAPEFRRRARTAIEIAGGLGLALLAALVVLGEQRSTFFGKGGFLLVAVATAAVILAILQPKSSVVRPALAWRPLAFLGLISYGVYLFHVPIFETLNQERTHLSGPVLFLVRAGVTFLVATATLVFVERPIRNGALKGRREVPLAIGAILVVIVLVFVVSSGARTPSTDETPTPFTLAALRNTAATAPAGATKVLVVGDLHAASLGSPLTPPARVKGIVGLAYGSLECGLAEGVPVLDRLRFAGRTCEDWPAHYAPVVDAYRPDVAMLMVGSRELDDREVGARVLKFGTAAFERELELRLNRAVAILRSRGANVLLTTVPCSSPSSASQRDERDIAWLNEVLRRYAARHADRVRIADVHRFLCTERGTAREGTQAFRAGPKEVFTPQGTHSFWAWLALQVAGANR